MTSWRTIVGSSETLSAADLPKDVTVRIESVGGAIFEQEDEGDGKRQDRKALIVFEGHQKKLAAGTINCLLLEAMWGEDYEDWIGRKLTIGPDKVEVAGKYKGDPCIRVKGSPELAKDKTVSISLPRRRPFDRKLTKTKDSEPETLDERYGETMPEFEDDGLFPKA